MNYELKTGRFERHHLTAEWELVCSTSRAVTRQFLPNVITSVPFFESLGNTETCTNGKDGVWVFTSLMNTKETNGTNGFSNLMVVRTFTPQ